MQNYKLLISYDGSRFYGWERQPDKDTVQGRIENVLSEMVKSRVEIIGAGRTDAGVHAKEMCANVHLNTTMTPDEIREYMNHYLPDDICILEVRTASDRFHARYNATGKLYTYTCYTGVLKPVFQRKFVTVIEGKPDIERMKEAALILQGKHDFAAFCANPRMKKSTVRNVDSIEIVQKKDLLYLNFHGEGFLQNMVRILTGTLLEVGFHRMSVEQVRQVLNGKDRKAAGPTAPAQGLMLMRVDYE